MRISDWSSDVCSSDLVPCTGCVLNDVQLCGREAVCVRSITVEEVWQAVRTNVCDLGVNQGLGRTRDLDRRRAVATAASDPRHSVPWLRVRQRDRLAENPESRLW